jgi:hypothetical protein
MSRILDLRLIPTAYCNTPPLEEYWWQFKRAEIRFQTSRRGNQQPIHSQINPFVPLRFTFEADWGKKAVCSTRRSFVNQTQMLHQMCHSLLSQADIKAICKNRGLPAQAASSPDVLESLFVSDRGLDAAFGSLEPLEISLLHRLKAIDKPVGVAFFGRLDPPKTERFHYGTVTQRYQGVLAQVKERLVRRGILLLALGRETASKTSQMERWGFSLPTQFWPHLPPLVPTARRLDGDGDWRREVPRAKLKTAVGIALADDSKDDKLEIVDGELCWSGQPFLARKLLDWQKRLWFEETTPKTQTRNAGPYSLLPAEAVLQILGGLDAGCWADTAALAVPLEIFCDAKVDGQQVCESGWRRGCLARQQADGKTWYRVAPEVPAAGVSPYEYLNITSEGTLTVDLETVPFEALEQLVMISSQQIVAPRSAVLLLAPNLVKLGRMADQLESLPLAEWLRKNSAEFQQAFETCRQRSGKTILHENLAVARVSDLALKVAIEKALGARIVSLGDEFIAFPQDLLGEVKRVVTKSGHVVKEA